MPSTTSRCAAVLRVFQPLSQTAAQLFIFCALAAYVVGCKSQPNVGPGNWFVGKCMVNGDAIMFGSDGPTCVMWRLPVSTTDWVWRVSTNGQTREWAVEHRYAHANDDPTQGQVWWIGDSTGSWSGTISPDNPRNGWGKLPTPPFDAFVIAGMPANGDGHIEGSGQKRGDEISLTLKWIKADGSMGSTYKLQGLGQNEQEYLKAIKKMNAMPPPIVQPFPQRSP